MISLFETSQKQEAPAFRDVYLKRLHEIAYGPNGKPSEATTTLTAIGSAVGTPPQESDSAGAVAVAEIKTTLEPPPASRTPTVEPCAFRCDRKIEAMTETITMDSRKLAEEIAPQFVNVFITAFEELGRYSSASNGRVSEVVNEMSRLSEQLQVLSGQMGATRRLIDSLTAAQRELFTQVSDIATTLREHEKIRLKLETETKQSQQGLKEQHDLLTEKLNTVADQTARINERLDAHANAIRTLHEGSPDRDSKRDELRSTLQKIQEIAGTLYAPVSLQEKL